MIPRSAVLSVIPARGGSKRLPRKNLLALAGRPLLEHTVRHSLAAVRVGRTVVSTDDDEIAKAARTSGAEVVERPAELATDSAPSEAALLHVLDYLRAGEGYEPTLVVMLQCTSPIRGAEDIDRAVGILETTEADAVLSVVPRHLFLWSVVDGAPRAISYDPARRPRTQELAPLYLENGSIYVTRTRTLRSTGNRLGGRVALFEMGPESLVDIDTEEELLMCERLLARQAGR